MFGPPFQSSVGESHRRQNLEVNGLLQVTLLMYLPSLVGHETPPLSDGRVVRVRSSLLMSPIERPNSFFWGWRKSRIFNPSQSSASLGNGAPLCPALLPEAQTPLCLAGRQQPLCCFWLKS